MPAVDIAAVVVSSTVVSGVVSATTTFFTQRYLLVRKAKIDAEAVRRKAVVDYESMARQRLYEAIGPLRMQLMFSARDVISRINGHAQEAHGWNMDPAAHYARSTIYRLLRPLAIAQLIERILGVADFTIDDDAIDLLRFGRNAERMLCSDKIVLEHPNVDWAHETQHLFRDNLRAAAARLIDDTREPAQVIRYDRFQRETPDPGQDPELASLAAIMHACGHRMTTNPIFWLRLVGYLHLCNELLRLQGVRVGFAEPDVDPADLLSESDDPHLSDHVDDYVHAIRHVASQGL